MISKALLKKLSKTKALKFTFQTSYALSEHYDVVISGAGPVGCAVACALQNEKYFQQNENKKILLLDIFQPPNLEQVFDKTLPDHRVVSLSYSSERFLKSIGAWQHMDEKRMGTVENIQVWENQGQGYVQFDSNRNYNGRALNYIVENNHIVGGLMKEIQNNNFVDTSFKNGITSFQRNIDNGNLLEISLQSGDKITADLIVGSEGRNSKVKELSKIPSYGWNYNQMGIVCTIKLSTQKNNQSYQKYLQSGPLAILPLWEDYCSIVWSCNMEDYEYLKGLGDIEFLNELNQALNSKSKMTTPNFDFDSDLFHFSPLVTEVCNKRLAFPLAQLQSQKYIADGVALVGDAAHSIHPQAGQGLNNGLNDAVAIANNIIQNLRTGNNIGQEISLKNYETEAKTWNYATALAMEAFQKVYSIQNPQFAFLRNLGANLLNNVNPLKSLLVESAGQNPYAPKQYEWEAKQ